MLPYQEVSISGETTSAGLPPFTQSQALAASVEPLMSPVHDTFMQFSNPFEGQQVEPNHDATELDHVDFLFDQRFSSPFFQLSPRLQSLMEYYDKNVCPFLVTFDDSNNPYRKHILQLAVHNEGLQHAIAALATNNIRMRKEPLPRQIGFIEEITDAFDGTSSSNGPSAEEINYKRMSIDQLNRLLADTRAAQDDSVLATLLILCLFHVCDSGFSKFKTQLAGVQKLLSLRNSSSGLSEFTGWVQMFFVWFDVMTSTVNDREMQVTGESLDMLDYSTNFGALEQFSGCDGRLFKLIARLGRLNLLSQRRPIRRQDGSMCVPRPPFSAPRQISYQTGSASIPADFNQLDGNGWGFPIMFSDEHGDSPKTADAFGNTSELDDRAEFWADWNDVREHLLAWRMEDAPISPSSPPRASLDQQQHEAGQRDLLHINESFRCAALLYTERLGHPDMPSSAPALQTHVTQALSHITALNIDSCVNKFLLWPLFIIGTECVDSAHRGIVRARCIEIQKESGFYNNISSLEVLERVWRADDASAHGWHDFADGSLGRQQQHSCGAERRGCNVQAFRWRRAMDRVDGEYLVI